MNIIDFSTPFPEKFSISIIWYYFNPEIFTRTYIERNKIFLYLSIVVL